MAALGAVFGADFEGRRMVERLAGYEVRIERSFEKALRLLERVRTERPPHVPAWRDPSEPEPERWPTDEELDEEARRNLERSEREEREWAERERQRRLAHPQGWLGRVATWLQKSRIPAAVGFVPQSRWSPAAG
jgi:hypothetical protein